MTEDTDACVAYFVSYVMTTSNMTHTDPAEIARVLQNIGVLELPIVIELPEVADLLAKPMPLKDAFHQVHQHASTYTSVDVSSVLSMGLRAYGTFTFVASHVVQP